MSNLRNKPLAFFASWTFLLILFSLLLTSCDQAPTSPSQNVAPETARSKSTIFFPLQKQPEGETGFHEALAVGKLVLVGSCLRLEIEEINESDLLIWPYGFSYRESGDTIEVLDNKGNVAVKVGQIIEVSGGEVPPPIEIADEEQIPLDCPGPYWFIGNEIRSNSND